MILNIKNYVSYNINELFKKGHLAVGILAGLVPALTMAYFILEGNTSFDSKHVSNFYCMLGMLAAELHPLYFVNRDYSSKTISLINNSKQNRKNYALANIFIALLVSFLYATVELLLILAASYLGVPGDLTVPFLLGFFVNVSLLVVTFFLFVYVLLLYGIRSAAVYVILTALLLFLHNILSNVMLIGTDNIFLFQSN